MRVEVSVGIIIYFVLKVGFEVLVGVLDPSCHLRN